MKTNFHTHTTFCDGKCTPQEMIQAALSKNFDMLGFSAHALFPFSTDWHLKIEDYDEYTKTILQLKKEYEDKIKILHGFEVDFIPGISLPSFENYAEFSPEFLIGSVHFVYNEKATFAVDGSPDEFAKGIKNTFNGDVKKAVSEYFSLQRQMLSKGNFSIIGHPDLVRKFNGILKIFDESEEWYKSELKATAQAIANAGVIAEINTGAIARGYQTSPYPSEYFLELLHEKNVPVTINSDSHHVDHLDCAFDIALNLAKKSGYKELAAPSKNKIEFYKI